MEHSSHKKYHHHSNHHSDHNHSVTSHSHKAYHSHHHHSNHHHKSYHHYRHRRSRPYSNRRRYHHHHSPSEHYYHHRSRKLSRSRDKSSKQKKTNKKVSASSSGGDKGHYKYTLGEVINERYKLVKFLGDGTFGRVIECEDIITHKTYAMKIIRPVTRYIESAEIESNIIIDVNKKDVNKVSHCIEIIEAFPFYSKGDKYFAMIFEEVGLSLFEFIKHNKYRGYSISQIRSFAKQILEGIGYLHSIGIIHTDLKPENILLIDSSYYTINDKSSWPSNVTYKEEKIGSASPSTRSLSKERDDVYNNVKQTDIKIIDFGGAVYTTENCSGIINTRQYRGPEVILDCCQWNEKSDVWSIACILTELYTGELLFATHDNEEHLCLIEKVCGQYPYWMARDCDKSFTHIFEKGKEKVGIDINMVYNKEKVIEALETQETLDDIILEEHKLFRDLLKKLLIIDPNLRPSCIEALKHDFFKVSY